MTPRARPTPGSVPARRSGLAVVLRPWRSRAAWDDWFRRALPAYWVFLFCATHFPELRLDWGIRDPDKYAHVTAFGLLAVLFWQFAETLYRPLSGRFAWLAAVWLTAYAAFDEYTQQFMGRGTNVADWLASTSGIVGATLVMEVLRRRRAHLVGK